MIKDSGERRAFDTGAVRDIQTGKGRMDLLPWAIQMEIKHPELCDIPWRGKKSDGNGNTEK